MTDLIISPESLLLLNKAIGPRREPPSYGIFMMAVLTCVPAKNGETGQSCWLTSDSVAQIFRNMAKWPLPDPPDGWMVVPQPGANGPWVAVYLVRGEL